MLEYVTSVAGSGYEWVNGYLREKPYTPEEPRKFITFPLQGEEPLYIQFSRLDKNTLNHASYKDFLQFANKNGPLTHHMDTNWGTYFGQENATYEDYWETSYLYWEDQCYWLNLTRELFLATKETSVTALKEKIKPFIRIEEITYNNLLSVVEISLASSTQLLDAIRRIQNKHTYLHIFLRDNQLHFTELYQIHHSQLPINASVNNVIHALLGSIIQKKMIAYSTTITFNYLGEWGMNISPTSLLAYMWASLAEEITGQKTYKQCRVCGKWEDRSSVNARKDWKEHPECGSRMRMREYREKLKAQKNTKS